MPFGVGERPVRFWEYGMPQVYAYAVLRRDLRSRVRVIGVYTSYREAQVQHARLEKRGISVWVQRVWLYRPQSDNKEKSHEL